MPVEIHRNEWLMLFCIHLAIFKSAVLLQEFVSRSEWHNKRAEINYKYFVALSFGCECWADCTQAAVLYIACLHFIAAWELGGEVSTKRVLFFHTSCFVSALPPTLLWAAKHQIHNRAAVLPLRLRSHILTKASMGIQPLDKPFLPWGNEKAVLCKCQMIINSNVKEQILECNWATLTLDLLL